MEVEDEEVGKKQALSSFFCCHRLQKAVSLLSGRGEERVKREINGIEYMLCAENSVKYFHKYYVDFHNNHMT